MKNKEIKNYYNNLVSELDNYEKKRWFSSDTQKKAYLMTKDVINQFLCKIDYSTCLELGPGHGTWTRKLIKKNPKAKYTLLDISEEMLKLSKERFAKKENLDYVCCDFLEFNADKQFDVLFSVRAIEYIDDKEKMVKKIKSLLGEGGKGFIITKTPKYLRAKILQRQVPAQHQNQISPKQLKKLFKKNGFKNIELYPVTVSFPFFGSASLNWLLYRILRRFRLNCLSQFFSESYSVKFSN